MSSPEKNGNKEIQKTKKRKVLLFLILVFAVFIGLLTAAVLYGYHHPSMVKGLLEKAISRTTDSSLTIDELSYSLSPLRIHASGIQWHALGDDPSYQLSINTLQADLVFDGPLGSRVLVIRSLILTNTDVTLSLGSPFPRRPDRGSSPSRLFRLVKKWFSICFFRDIQLEAVEIRQAFATAGNGDLYLEAAANKIQYHHNNPVDIAFHGRLRLPSRGLFVDLPQCWVNIEGPLSFENSKVGGHLRVANGSATSPVLQGDALALSSSFEYNPSYKTVDIASASLQGDMHLVSKIKETPQRGPLKWSLTTEGLIRFGSQEIEAYAAHLWVDDIGFVKGGLKMIWGPSPSLSIETVEGSLRPHKIIPWLPDSLKEALSSLTLGGDYHLKGLITARPRQEQWRWSCDLGCRFEKNTILYRADELALKGRVTGEFRAKGPLPSLKLTARLVGTDFALSTENIQIEPAAVSFNVSGVYPEFEILDFFLALPNMTLPIGEDSFALPKIRVTAKRGKAHGETREIHFPQFFFDSSLVRRLKGSFTAGKEGIEISVNGRKTGLIKAALMSQRVPDGWEGDGVDDVNVTWVKKKEGSWILDSQVHIQNLSFQDLQGRFMGEGLAIKSGIKGRFDPKINRFSFKIDFETAAGEILLDRFYSNFTQNGLKVDSSGAYDLTQRFWSLSPLELQWGRLCALKGNISLHEGGGGLRTSLRLHLPATPLVPLFDQLIIGPFQTEYPTLKALDLAGEISADLSLVRSPHALEAKGLFSWHNGHFTHGSAKGLSLEGITLDLPIWYQKGQPDFHVQQTARVLSNTPSGALSFQAAMPPFIPKQSLVLPLKAERNCLNIMSSTRVQTAGGDILLGPLEIKDLTQSPHMKTTLSIQQLDPLPFLASFLPNPPSGSFNALLDPIRFQNGTIVATGEAEARIFEGILTFSNLTLAGLGQGTPVFRFDAQWEDISLTELTKDTGFGRIDGIMGGHMHSVEIAYGQPQKFDLLLETMPTKGVRQRISVKAVDNIAQIGGGQSPFIGAAGFIATFLKELPYSKIGIRASLENDLFNIGGTIHDQGKEYLIKRGSFSGVDIVNQNPDNRISFKDMMNRIKRIKPLDGASVVK